MILLDTDIVSLYHTGHERVTQRIRKVYGQDVVGTTVITRAEMLRPRFDSLLKAASGEELLRAQERLQRTELLLKEMHVALVDSASVSEFGRLSKRKKLKKIGHADLLIASIALANGALLVTRNLKHFRQVPNLKIENWAD